MPNLSFRHLAPFATAVAAFAPVAAAQTVVIDFDGAPAPCYFSGTIELTGEYAAQGITFSGPTAGTGGAILDQCGNFGVNGRSGQQFLALNPAATSQSGVPHGPQSIVFDPSASAFSIWASGGYGAGDFVLNAYRNGVNVGSINASSPVAAYVELQFSDPLGFDRVVIDQVGPAGFWVFDDLTVDLGPPIGTFCFGDGSGQVCPCGNSGLQGEGCQNSTGAGGQLRAGGLASLAADSLVLTADQAPPNRPGLFFQGTAKVNGGAGAIFGDGLRCVGAQVTRLQVVQTDASGAAATGVQISSLSSIAVGDQRFYQFWYRDPSVGPCGGGFNLTNGLAVTWQ